MARPRFVICDEPTSALDLSVQAHVLNLLNELQDDFELSYLFVSHDLAVVRHVSRRIVVLYHGRIMEQGDAAGLYADPLHPYTQALLAAAPVPDPDEQRRRRSFRPARAAGDTGPSRANSCPFAPHCPYATGVCFTERPPLEFAESGTSIACHHWRDLRPRGEQPSLYAAVVQKR
jgi:peptide/nickel transport system ATP-binding protein